MTDSNPTWEGPGRGRGRVRAHHGAPFGPGAFPHPFGPGGPFAPGGPMGPRGRGRGRRGHVRNAIVALLAEEPLNGYQIMQTLADRTEGAWKPSPGAVYPALAQLEDEGLIEAFDNQGQKAFRLTEAGTTAAAEVEKPWEMVNEAVAGLGSDQLRELWAEFPRLAGAIKELSRGGNAQQLEQATKLLAQTRRGIYALLASDDELANGDDLR
jgi:DNA-binding PadR family transcriptional regulator